jgi:uncharacterized protein DUF2383
LQLFRAGKEAMPATLIANDVDTLNAVLRASLSAAAAYRSAIRRIERHGQGGAIALRVILQSHLKNAQKLRNEIRGLGGMPDEHTGAWGAFAKSMEGAASLFGSNAELAALKEAELHALHKGEEALAEGGLERSAEDLLRGTVVRDFSRHVELLEALAHAA